MSFGFSGASQSFQPFIDTAFRGITITLPNGPEHEVSIFAYIDDILLASSNHDMHMLELRAVFQCLSDFGLRISPLKCEFGALSMEFLWHLINKDGIAPLPEKVAAMRSYETPRIAKELRRYLGMFKFYRFKHAANASDTAVAEVLYQKSAAIRIRPLSFFSRRLNT